MRFVRECVAVIVLSLFRIERCHEADEGVPFDYTYSGGILRCLERVFSEGCMVLPVPCGEPYTYYDHDYIDASDTCYSM